MSPTTLEQPQDQGLELWEPDPSWHTARVEAFTIYRDMGPDRSLCKVHEALNKSKELLGRWSMQDDWQKRVRAWDRECDKRRREEFHLGEASASREQAETAARVRLGVDAFAQAFLDKLAEYRERGEAPFADLTPSQMLSKMTTAARALQSAQQVERLAHGLSTDNVAGHDGGPLIGADVAEKSPEQIQAYLAGREDAMREQEGQKATT